MKGERQKERRALLASSPLFAKLTERELDALVQVARLEKASAREELCHKGDTARQIFLIVSGRLKAMTTSSDGDDVVFSIMGPGEVFGEIGVLAGGQRTATIVAIDHCELLVIDRRDILLVLRSQPEVAIKLLEVLANRCRLVSELMEDVQFLNLPARLAKKLLHLAGAYGIEVGNGLKIDLKLSQTELGDLIATTRESINKQMRLWAEEGILSMEQGYVTIHRIDSLESLAALTSD